MYLGRGLSWSRYQLGKNPLPRIRIISPVVENFRCIADENPTCLPWKLYTGNNGLVQLAFSNKVPYVASILGKNRLFQKAKKRWAGENWRAKSSAPNDSKPTFVWDLATILGHAECREQYRSGARGGKSGKDGGRVEKTNFVGRGTSTPHFMYALTACSWSNSGHWWWEPLSTINLRTADSSWYAM